MNLDELLAASIVIDEEVFAHFASSLVPLDHELIEVLEEGGHPIHASLIRQLSTIDDEYVELVLADGKFMRFHGAEDATERRFSARIWALQATFRYQIPARRISCLRDSETGSTTPAPLAHPALSGIAMAKDFLVPLSEFDITNRVLVRNGFAFAALAPAEASNSQYWYFNALCAPELRRATWVRLDPLLVRPADDIDMMHYKVWVYGRPLNWPRLRALREAEHGQWMPEPFAHGIDVTEFAWTPRDGQIHFQCEELPASDSLARRGGRYFHAIYDPRSDDIVHLDAAIRTYDNESWQVRRTLHVRNAGKAGWRHKVFRVEGHVSVDHFCNLVACFFMWNSDVQRYFGADIPEGL